MLTRADMIMYLRRYLRAALLVGFDMADVEEGAGGVVDKVLERLKVKKADRADVVLDGDKEQAAYALLDFYVSAALLPVLRECNELHVVQLSIDAMTRVNEQSRRRTEAMGYRIPKGDMPDLTPPTGPTG